MPGLNGTIFIEIGITDDISLQPEFAFMLNQFTLDNFLPTVSGSTPEITFIICNEFHWSFVEKFISIPLLIKVNLFNSTWYSLNIQNGLSIGWLQDRIVMDGADELDGFIKKGHKNELPAVFGIENVFHTYYGDFIVNLRYQRKLFNNYKAINGQILDMRYDTLNFSISYAYSFQRLFDH